MKPGILGKTTSGLPGTSGLAALAKTLAGGLAPGGGQSITPSASKLPTVKLPDPVKDVQKTVTSLGGLTNHLQGKTDNGSPKKVEWT